MGEVEQAFVEAARGRGLVIRELVADGQIHRCGIEGKKGGDAGWYVLHLDGHPRGAFGSWADGQEATRWSHGKASEVMSPGELAAWKAEQVEAAKAREEAKGREQEAAAARVVETLEKAAPASGTFGYLESKGVAATEGVKRMGSTLLIPLKDAGGRVVNLQRIWQDRETGRWVKTYEKAAKRAGTFHAIGGSRGTVAICEGYSTGVSIHAATGWTVLCAMDSGQLMAVAKMAARWGKGATLVVAADDDWASERNAGQEAGREAAAAIGARLVWPEWPEGHERRGTDFNDLHQTMGLDAVRAAMIGTRVVVPEVEEAFEITSVRERRWPMPDGWKVETGYLKRRVVVGPKARQEWVPVCYPAIWVQGRSVALETGDHFVTLAYGGQEAEGEEVPAAEACQARTLVGWRRRGLPVTSNTAKALVDYIDGALAIMAADEEEARRERRPCRWPVVALASSTGWVREGDAFVRGYEEVHYQSGRPSMELRMALLEGEQRDTVKAIRCSGSLAGWRAAVAPVLDAHPRAVYAMAAAVVPPMLRLFGASGAPFALDLSGNSSVGKTTALKLAASIWGTSRQVGSWKDTNTAAERIAGALRGLPIFRDESQLADDLVAAGNFVYEITQGRGKARGTITGTQRSVVYESVLISTGETPLAGMREAGGLVARCVTIWGPIFGEDSPRTKKLLQGANRGIEAHHGVAGKALVEWLVALPNEKREAMRIAMEERAAMILDRRPPTATTSEAVQRIAIYLAEMEVAWWAFTEATGLKWKGQGGLLSFMTDAEVAEVLARGAEADKAASAMDGVVGWVAANRSRMQWHGNAPDHSMPILGRVRDEKGELAVYLLPDALHDYLKSRSLNTKATIATFLDRGWLVKGEGRSTHKIYLGGGTPWCYRLNADLSGLCGVEHDRAEGKKDYFNS